MATTSHKSVKHSPIIFFYFGAILPSPLNRKKNKTPSNSLLKIVLVIKPTSIILVLSLITLKKGEGGGGRQVNN